MQGSLTTTSAVDLCLRLADEAVTGTLVLSTDDAAAELGFVEGHLSDGRVSGAAGDGTRLGARLVAVGLLDAADLDAVLAEQADDPVTTPLGQRLVDRGLVGTDAVRLGLQEQALDALQVVTGWSEGSFRFEVAAPTAGVRVAMPVQRALREAGRRTGDRRSVGRREPALQPVGLSADREGTAPSREEFALPASPTTGTRPADLADEGWAHRLDTTPPAPDEPEPWVGWANGARHAEPSSAAAPSEATPSQASTPPPATPPPASTQPPASTPPPAATPPAAPRPAESAAPSPSPHLDAETRRELFSELHEMGRPTPASDHPAPPPTPQVQPPAPEAGDVPEDVDEVEIPPPAPAPTSSLSRSDVSELLAELHALNLDDDDRA